MAGKKRPLWYKGKNGKVVDSAGVPLNNTPGRAGEDTYLRKKQEANNETARKNPGLKKFADMANEGLSEQRKDLRNAKKEARSQVRLKDVNSHKKGSK